LEVSSLLSLSNKFHQTLGETSILESFTNAPLTLEALETPGMKWRSNTVNHHSPSLTE